jgi:hypothetical protein
MRASFRELEECLKDNTKYPRLRKILVRTRSNLTFDYNEDGKLITTAINEMAKCAATRHSPITCGNTGYFWYFQAADDVVRSILVNQILGIAQDDEAETNKIMDELHSISCFHNFCQRVHLEIVRTMATTFGMTFRG